MGQSEKGKTNPFWEEENRISKNSLSFNENRTENKALLFIQPASRSVMV